MKIYVVVGLESHPKSKKALICSQCDFSTNESTSLDIMKAFANNGANPKGVYRFCTQDESILHLTNPFVYTNEKGERKIIEFSDYQKKAA